MSTAKLSDDTPLDPDDETLVAYLDGELDRKGQAELENRLLENQELRSRLQQLQTGWDLLDDLPNPEPSLKLVESTLELVVADIVKTRPPSASIWSRFRLPISVVGLCLVGVIAAYAIAATTKARAYQRQLQDLAIVENLNAFNHGSDLTLMRQLSADPAWIQMVAASREIGDIQIEMITNVSATPAAEREQLIEKLPLEKREELNSRWERFMRFDEENRQRIRRTAEAVSQQADAEFLLQSMQAYARWRENLPTELRDRIESDDPKERRVAIKEAIEREQKSISRRSSLKLSTDAIDWIYFALRQIVQQRVNEGDEATTRQLERFKSFTTSGIDPVLGVIFSITRSESSGRGRGFPRLGGVRPGGERSSGAPAPLRLDELELIRLSLPDRERDILDSVAGGHPLNEAMTLGHWAEEAARRNSPWAGRDKSTLLERYNELPNAERERIDLLPPKEILNELQRDSIRPPPSR
jgi:hypothetical protein